jgi:hypothetical protein
VRIGIGKGKILAAIVTAALILAIGWAEAQRQRGGRDRDRGGFGGFSSYSTAGARDRAIFPGNKFTFCRVIYSEGRSRGGFRWDTDYPDSDINFSMRLAEVTTIDVNRDETWKTWDNPLGIVHKTLMLEDDDLWEYPILYLIEPGSLEFNPTERERLREYLLRGGFLHVDDFWGTQEWRNFEYEMSQVLPPDEFPMVDIPLDHPIFSIVFPVKEVPQVPSIGSWRSGRTSERGWDSAVPHMYGIWDHNDRLMVVVTFNTDLGDGWEREGENRDYFEEMSVKRAYPLGINIVVYAMTH